MWGSVCRDEREGGGEREGTIQADCASFARDGRGGGERGKHK